MAESKSNTSSNKTKEKDSEVADPKEATSSKQQPQLSALEEDDEFEEFPVQDWDDAETELGNLKGGQPGGAKSGGDRLWEDNWDDDDIEEEFNLQLRNELAKAKEGAGASGSSAVNAMQH